MKLLKQVNLQLIIYNQLYRNCSNLPYTPYGELVDSIEEKINKNDYDLL